ncbi:MAG: preprotein translocase subunit SecA [Candidatus Caccosoma sp.]|nr:preprotein translocase subunit SecA [Candidatus Caccosoma sp.]
MGLLKKIFNVNKKHLKKLHDRAIQIDALKDDIAKLSDDELRNKTKEFQAKLAGIENREELDAAIDSILNEAFAVCREAAKRVLHQFPYVVQIMGALAIHDGDIAEMKTGEGKTLTATMAVYTNALTGKGVHVVTVNEYLAHRDAEWMGEIYRFLGLTVGCNLRELSPEEKRQVYSCDITYTTNSELGFDYLRDNMARSLSGKVQVKGLNYCVIDECDSILIDEARTPLIISGGNKANAALYVPANRFARSLIKGVHFDVDVESKAVFLTEKGNEKAEKDFGIKNLYDMDNTVLLHCINNALKANYAMARDVDYVVQDDEIVIVDANTGRFLKGRAYSDGLHQAIQAKEKVTIKPETVTLATITYQNYFRLYSKLSGMTGTAKSDEEELLETYNMRVIEIPTNVPVVRIDDNDIIFGTKDAKYKALIEDVKQRHAKGQPVLVGTIAVETSEVIYKLMLKQGLKPEILNAKNHEREAEIIKNAGQVGAITIATNMAGRGTDIKLGEGVKELGGLAVLGSERHESRRIDNQLRGRSGRQGDVGYSRFYISLEDDLMKRFGGERWQKFFTNSEDAISFKMIDGAINSAQKKVEGVNYDSRKHLLEYDNVLSQQREKMYRLRDQVLNTKDCYDITKKFYDMVANRIVTAVSTVDGKEMYPNIDELVKHINTMYLSEGSVSKEDFYGLERFSDYVEKTRDILMAKTEERRKEWGEEAYLEIQSNIILRVIDRNWPAHIDKMTKLRDGIMYRQYANANPLVQYKNDGFKMFNQMLEEIANEVVLYTLRVQVQINTMTPEQVAQAEKEKTERGE